MPHISDRNALRGVVGKETHLKKSRERDSMKAKKIRSLVEDLPVEQLAPAGAWWCSKRKSAARAYRKALRHQRSSQPARPVRGYSRWRRSYLRQQARLAAKQVAA